MLINEMITRLEEIKQMHGNLPLYAKKWSSDDIVELKHTDVVCIASNSSSKFEEGVYLCLSVK